MGTSTEDATTTASDLGELGWTVHETPPRPDRRRLLRQALVALLVVTVVVGVATAGTVLWLQSRLGGQVHHIDQVFAGLEDRPARAPGAAGEAMNILLMGTDRRSTEPTTGTDATASEWVPGAQRTDTIMILHIDADREGASLISIPRDSWVYVPGFGMNKINAAFSLAGPSLAIETIERLTALRIDHLAVVDWAGFEAITDAVGGVTLTVPRTVTDPQNNVVWSQGRQTLDGRQALLYVRQRYGLPNGDLDRVRRQQAYLLSLMRASISTLRSKDPFATYDLLDIATRNLSVDSEWSTGEMRSTLLDLRGMRGRDLDLLSTPVQGYGDESGQSVVYLDFAAAQRMWEAVYDDKVEDWVEDNPDAAQVGPAD
ncbi:LCP family protein [Nocardioides sp. SR21]|uniref:LCP family protein n=1 Tax=Nocardioides sp. SR21 TaxID=2919501 RepID=UPI001FAB2821|nr:LCP family protein [Nocardioides sp. SR21]